MIICVQVLCGHNFSFLVDMFSFLLSGICWVICLIFRRTARPFSNVAAPFYILTITRPPGFHILANTFDFVFFIIALLVGGSGISLYYDFNLHCPDVLIGHSQISFEEMSVQLFRPFFNQVVFLLVSCISVPYHIYDLQNFLPLCEFLDSVY